MTDVASPTYYDRPVLKEPVWIWSVPAYFATGGAAAGAALIGAVAQAADRDGYAGLIDRCRLIAAGGTTLGTAFLIHDLGRPARFLNMLRVFRPTSAMSVGSWVLAAASTASAGSVVLPRLGARGLGDVAGAGAGVLAPALGTYTGVLLADTSVPVWRANRRTLPVLFCASAVATASDLLELAPVGPREAAVSRRLGIAAKVAELAAGRAVVATADRVASVGRPLHEGASGAMWRAAEASTAVSLLLSFLPVPGGLRRVRRVVAAVVGLVGAVLSRFAIFQAGTASARDPRATFDAQRAGLGAAEVHDPRARGRRART